LLTCQNLRLALILANIVAASVNNRAIIAAVSGNLRGSATVACSGQAILMIAGHVVGSIELFLIRGHSRNDEVSWLAQRSRMNRQATTTSVD
jgi:hypothetical protein